MKEKIINVFKRPRNLVIIAIVILAGWGLSASFGGQKANYELVTVQRGEIIQRVSVTGKVKPADSVELAFEKSGKLSSLDARVGDRVVAGQRLASLNNSETAAQLAQAQASLDKEVVKLAELKAGTRPEEMRIAQTTVSNAEKTLTDVLNKAEIDLNNYYDDVKDILNEAYIYADDAVNKQTDELFTNDNATNPSLSFRSGSQITSDAEAKRYLAGLEVAQFKQKIDVLKNDQAALDASLLDGKVHLEKILDFLNSASQAVNESSGLTSTALTNYKYYVNTGRTNVNSSLTEISNQIQLISAQKATNQSNISTAQNTLAAARDQLALKQAGSTQEEIAAQEAQVKYAQANAQNYQAALSKMIIISPIAGLITKKEAEVGEIVAANTSILAVLSLAKFEVEANVSENEIAKVSLGDQVIMTLDALGATEKFSGKIVKIDPAETVVSGVIYYKVTSVFDADDQRIKSGMTVNLDIQTDKKEGVLTLPYYVIKGQNNEKYVEVSEKNQPRKVFVKTGLEGETMVEITEGLVEGQQVLAGQ